MNAVATTITEDTVMMTSLELVELINATREPGKSPLRHDHLMVKVPKVLGVGMSPKFLGHIKVHGPNGGFRQSPIYRLPKREACQVAMS